MHVLMLVDQSLDLTNHGVVQITRVSSLVAAEMTQMDKQLVFTRRREEGIGGSSSCYNSKGLQA